MDKKYGFYSRKQESLFARLNESGTGYLSFSHRRIDTRADNVFYSRVAIYSTPDGREVECTEVSSYADHRSNFDDWVCLGEVKKYLRSREPYERR